MRLIDADKICQKLPFCNLKDEIENAPKEKAISIQWLKDWNKKNGDNWNLGYTIDYIIKEWEKENER